MDKIVGQLLLNKLRKLSKKADYKGNNLNEYSFNSGYANGFIKGYYTMLSIVVTLMILLVISLVLAFIV